MENNSEASPSSTVELITSLVSSSVKSRASEAMTATQQFIRKTADGALLGAVLSGTPRTRVVFDLSVREGQQEGPPCSAPRGLGTGQRFATSSHKTRTATPGGSFTTPTPQVRKLV